MSILKDHSIDRRQALKLGASASAMAFLTIGGCSVGSKDRSGELLKFVSDSNSPIDPQTVGELSASELNVLFSCCKYVNSKWKLTENLYDYLMLLNDDLSLKTSVAPSYLSEYKQAIGLIEEYVDVNNPEEGWHTLFFKTYEVDQFENTRLGRARKFVFSEIIKHMVPISQGFRTFGLKNYRGYFGGSYQSPGSYRKAVAS